MAIIMIVTKIMTKIIVMSNILVIIHIIIVELQVLDGNFECIQLQ